MGKEGLMHYSKECPRCKGEGNLYKFVDSNNYGGHTRMADIDTWSETCPQCLGAGTIEYEKNLREVKA